MHYAVATYIDEINEVIISQDESINAITIRH